MTAAYLVIYEGRPQDPGAFLQYYIDTHVPIIWTWPSIRNVELELGDDGGDFFMIARFTFDSIQDLRAALTSPQREHARADREQFPPFHGTIRHQAVRIRQVTA
ncbi:EthD family reductase [Dactylosporangium sp. CA-092794]|uniref:EthD family reductase n=1 Tax=Dactylosporangium sp. CA-092794 TaxID=3239929 RepID=UPI003D91D585